MIDAILKAAPIMLEPIVNIEITAPDRFVGDLTSDLSGKRGQVTGTESTGGDLMSITGMVPLSEVAEYQSRLRSVTGGQGAYTDRVQPLRAGAAADPAAARLAVQAGAGGGLIRERGLAGAVFRLLKTGGFSG